MSGLRDHEWPMNIKIIALSALVLVAVAFLLAMFSSITNEDATAKLRFIDPSGQVAQALPAMHFAISDHGDIYGPICDLPSTADFEPLQRTLVFTNLLGQQLPFLVSFARLLYGRERANDRSIQASSAKLEWNAEILQTTVAHLDQITSEMVTGNEDCANELKKALSLGQCVARVSTV
jgi:hypothetical protein